MTSFYAFVRPQRGRSASEVEGKVKRRSRRQGGFEVAVSTRDPQGWLRRSKISSSSFTCDSLELDSSD